MRGSRVSGLGFGVQGLGTFLGVPIIRTIVFGGLCWGPLILGSYHIGFRVFKGFGVQGLGFRVT